MTLLEEHTLLVTLRTAGAQRVWGRVKQKKERKEERDRKRRGLQSAKGHRKGKDGSAYIGRHLLIRRLWKYLEPDRAWSDAEENCRRLWELAEGGGVPRRRA